MDRTVYTRMLFPLAEIPYHQFGFNLLTVTSHLDMLNRQLLDTIYSHPIICGETTLPRIVEKHGMGRR